MRTKLFYKITDEYNIIFFKNDLIYLNVIMYKISYFFKTNLFLFILIIYVCLFLCYIHFIENFLTFN